MTWLWLALLAGCTRSEDSADTGDPIVIAGPLLVHTPVASLPEDQSLTLDVEAADADGVGEIKVFYRTVGTVAWEPIVMTGDETGYSATVPASRVSPPAIEYYFRAEDASELAAVSYLPEAGQEAPFQVTVDVVGLPLPFTEGFESSSTTVFSIGWSDFPLGFAGYSWDPTPSRAYGGFRSAAHPRAAADSVGLDDWLVTPPLDLSTTATAQVTWYEYGDAADLGTHSLWISTGSPDPADGDFVSVADLPDAPEDAWGRSDIVDLTPYVGAPVAYLAWRYQGDYADSWFIDDVEVRELGPDVQFGEVTWDRVDPGGTTTVRVSLTDASPLAAAGVVLSGVVDAADGAFGDPDTVGDIAAFATVDAALELTVDAGHPDNALLPVTLVATDGTHTWTHDVVLVVGDRSVGSISLSTTGTGLVTASLGRGSLASPDVEIPVVASVLAAGAHDFTVDLSDHGDLLPPGPGPERWWLRVHAGVTGSLTAFSIAYDGVSTPSDDLGAFSSGLVRVFNLPKPPVPVLQSTVSDPSPVTPGSTATLTFTLSNGGSDTVGETTATVTSAEAGVEILTADPIVIAADGWEFGVVVPIEVDVAIAPTKVDSRPVTLTVRVEDAVESWTLTTTLPVPSPVMKVTGLEIDDRDLGDDDGLLDPGERAFLDIELANVGGAASFGGVTCAITPQGGPAVTVHHASGGFGLMAAGTVESEDAFEVEVTAGAAGDVLTFAVACTDLQATYATALDVELGAPPWRAITVVDDPTGDAVNGYDFDLVGGRYRSDGDTLDIELTSAVEQDPNTLFIEAWGNSAGAQYTYYEFVAQSGVGHFRGYELGLYYDLPEPVITTIDAHTVRITLDVSDAGLVLPQLNLGFASGFCGGATYYCDQYPDGWGNPFQTGFVTSRWVRLSW